MSGNWDCNSSIKIRFTTFFGGNHNCLYLTLTLYPVFPILVDFGKHLQKNILHHFQRTRVDFINCFAPYADLLRFRPNFYATTTLLKSWAKGAKQFMKLVPSWNWCKICLRTLTTENIYYLLNEASHRHSPILGGYVKSSRGKQVTWCTKLSQNNDTLI